MFVVEIVRIHPVQVRKVRLVVIASYNDLVGEFNHRIIPFEAATLYSR